MDKRPDLTNLTEQEKGVFILIPYEVIEDLRQKIRQKPVFFAKDPVFRKLYTGCVIAFLWFRMV
jgi:hypothetical protein